MLLHVISSPFLAIQYLLIKSIQISIISSLIYVFAERLGILKRLLQVWIEYQLSQISNGAPISISDLEFQLIDFSNLKSTLIVHDAVVHTPEKNDWKWESPLIARVGYVKVTANLLSLLDLPYNIKQSLEIRMNPIKDIYSLEMKDVQVFIEKRRNIFNFHLLDERLDLPSAIDVLESLTLAQQKSSKPNDPQSESIVSATGTRNHSSSSIMKSASYGGDAVTTTAAASDEEADAEGAKKADELVKTIVGAVSTLGRAANEGGTQALSNALRNQKDGFVSHLKNVQKIVGFSNENESKEKSTSIGIAKESIQVMKQVGKVVEKNVKNMKEQVDALSKPPLFRQNWAKPDNPELFRFGFIFLQDVRIFTKDIIVVPGSEEKAKAGITNHEIERQTISAMGWSKPIIVEEIKLHPTELCPLKDGSDSFVGVGQPIENIMNVVLERIFTEMAANSISGKLLNNAFADVFAWFKIGKDS